MRSNTIYECALRNIINMSPDTRFTREIHSCLSLTSNIIYSLQFLNYSWNCYRTHLKRQSAMQSRFLFKSVLSLLYLQRPTLDSLSPFRFWGIYNISEYQELIECLSPQFIQTFSNYVNSFTVHHVEIKKVSESSATCVWITKRQLFRLNLRPDQC